MTTPTPWHETALSSHVLAGLLGSMVALRWAPGATWGERVCNVGAGFACAVYLTPAAAEWFEITSPRGVAAMAFAAGMFGLSLAAAVVEAIKSADLGEVLRGWLSRRD